MNAVTKLKYIKELKSLISQDIKSLSIKAKLTTIKRIKELVNLLGGAISPAPTPAPAPDPASNVSKDKAKEFLTKVIKKEILPDEQSLVTMQDYLNAFNSDEEIDQLTTQALNVWLEYLLNNVAQLM